jgi:hypothetical protein
MISLVKVPPFYDFPGGSDEQVLVSNCMDSEFGAVEIALAPRNKEVIFRADTLASGPAEIRLPYKVTIIETQIEHTRLSFLDRQSSDQNFSSRGIMIGNHQNKTTES